MDAEFNQAFAITEDDVRMVLLEMGLPVSDAEVARWTDGLDHTAITRAALDCSDDLDEQTFGAMNAVRDQILMATQAQRTAEAREARTLTESLAPQEGAKRVRRRSMP